MGSIGDFHTHSTYSDGKLTPTQLADMAHRNGVRVMALTDHDTTEGLVDMAEALCRYPEISLVKGVELSTDIPGSEIHILGYFMDVENEGFQRELACFREGRLGRGQEMVRKLQALGMPVTWERVQEIAGDASVGRPHVAQALLEQGHVKTIAEAFDRFIGREGPAYAERDKLTPEQAIELIRGAGGVAFFAHPSYTKDIEGVLPRMKQAGLTGMEVYYRSYPPETVDWLRSVAERFELMPLGGSDYHGLGNEGDREIGDIPLPEGVVNRFLAVGQQILAQRQAS
ncbi:MAG TPA: PHP domain-containing protein [Dehalococcoidia bacterium]|nr:PHP domain-containing protein [Dehalococcoidia bacterium]